MDPIIVAADAGPVWQPIRFQVRGVAGMRSVAGVGIGPFGLYDRWQYFGEQQVPVNLRVSRWPITHLPTGRAVVRAHDGWAAVACIDRLYRVLGKDFAGCGDANALQHLRGETACIARQFGIG